MIDTDTDTNTNKLNKKIRMEFIYNAIEEGWTVRKDGYNRFEFTISNITGKHNIENIKNYGRSISFPCTNKKNNYYNYN